MIRYSIIFFCMVLWGLPRMVMAQGQNNMWTFGQNNGLNFNTTPPTFFQSSNLSTEGCASVADSAGNLLFYSNGNTVWNASGTVMPNGNGILGNGPAAGGLPASSAQGVAIVQLPANHKQYYLFTLDAAEDIFGSYTGYLRYSLIDMTLNGGNGDVVASQKNIVLDEAMSEKMTVAKGAGCYYWLLTHRNNSATYRAFKIDAAGIQPGISSTGSWAGDKGAGQLKISPDGTKIATCNSIPNSGIEIGSFDNTTGIVSNTSIIDINATSGIGTCFSPDNSKLYIAGSNLAQYDMSAYPNFTAIESSKVILSAGNSYSNLRNGPDEKIYIAFYSNNPFIGVINNPNSAGTAANVVINAMSEPAWAAFPGNIYGHGLGNDNVYGLTPDITINPSQDITGCDGNDMVLAAPQGFGEYTWNDGITTQSRQVTTAGTYWVLSANACTIFIDTFHISFVDLAVNLGPDTAICNDDSLLLNATYPGATYRWQDGSDDATFLTNKEGTFSVRLLKEGCMVSDTIRISYLNPFVNIIEDDTLLCKGDMLTLHPESRPLSTYNWSTGSNNETISVNGSGIYTVTASNVCGIFSDSVNIRTQECDCLAFIPNAFTPNGDDRNDIYKIDPRCMTANFSMSIYNRFGERVFQSQSPDIGWDGLQRGQLCDVGTYFYFIHFTGPRGNDIERKGDLMLLR